MASLGSFTSWAKGVPGSPSWGGELRRIVSTICQKGSSLLLDAAGNSTHASCQDRLSTRGEREGPAFDRRAMGGLASPAKGPRSCLATARARDRARPRRRSRASTGDVRRGRRRRAGPGLCHGAQDPDRGPPRLPGDVDRLLVLGRPKEKTEEEAEKWECLRREVEVDPNRGSRP